MNSNLTTFIKQHNKGYKKKFSKQSRIVLQRLFELMQQGKQKFDSEYEHKHIQIEPHPTFPKGDQFHYLDQDVQQKISQLGEFTVAQFSVGSLGSVDSIDSRRKIRIFISSEHGNKNEMNSTNAYIMLESIYIWLFVASHFAGKTCSNELDIYLYLSDLQKTLPERDGQIIDSIHANTAFTFACNYGDSKRNEIYIYRKEELFKVLLHETFHSLGIDFAAMPIEAAVHEIEETIYRVSITDLRFYESYTEMWAEIMHAMFVCFRREPNHMIFDLECMIFEYEAPFSVFQCVKVLDHQDLLYEDLFHVSHAKSYKENTQVLAYYVMKSVFMNYANEFIEWCADHNEAPYFLFFKKTQENVKSFVGLLRTYAKTPEYLEKIEKMQQVLDRGVPFTVGETLRMTVIG